ncbi:MAG: glucose-6-phosphate isomerase [Angelakisella sp.]|jgi:glucose-6-phosphate isomerase|nr:glucose-6-phosphate isomerase [Angelakisella sp.]MCI9529485.1 glucose-6-phosphate isomerase [Angelakisella sp.]
MAMKLKESYLAPFVSPRELEGMAPMVAAAARQVEEGSGLGNDFLGWVHLPTRHDQEEVRRIKAAAEKIQKDSQVLIVIGIGGSYLGARSAIELMKGTFYNQLRGDRPEVIFTGCNISSSYLQQVLAMLGDRDFSVNVISKSGTTTEPALAFRLFRKLLIEKYGEKEAAGRIYCTTDKARGTLKELADREGYETFVIPDDVGGRYSVLTAVGLLPIAVAGCDIDKILEGAIAAEKELAEPDLAKNDCYRYAALRNILCRKGKTTEIFVTYEPAFTMMNEWLKQLFGESEGKDQKGIFPASVAFSTDLHSMGQFIQDGNRNLFETVVDIQKPAADYFIEKDPENLDGLNFLSGQEMSKVNRRALEGTILAHTEGGVPNLVLELPDTSEYEYGYMVYFFEKACAVSGYLSGVNPFDQPGVEAYKKNMFALLGKPGYEELRADLLEKLK